MSWMPRRLILLLAGSVLLLAPLIGAQLTTGSGRAHACSCSPSPPPAEALGYADAVFSGRVVGSGGEFSLKHFSAVEIDVDTVWKGSITSTTFVYVWFGASCGYDRFELDEDFLVYAHHDVFPVEDDNTLFVHLCSRTRPLEYAEEDLLTLGAGQAPEPGITAAMPASEDEEQNPGGATTVDSSPRDSLHSLAWWAPLLAGIAAAALIIRRWARHREPE